MAAATSRRVMSRLYYFTIEDEGMLAEAFSSLDNDTIAIAYKVLDTEDVFIAPSETKDALDRQDVHLNLLAEEDSAKVSIYHSPLSREELVDYEEALKALTLASHGMAMACVGVNGESDLGFDLSNGTQNYTYFTAPAGHTFIFRVFTKRDEAYDFLDRLTIGDEKALEWVESLPIDSVDDLVSYH